jgi:hypothetical protein
LVRAILSLAGRPGVHGDTVEQLKSPTSKYWAVIKGLDKNKQFVFFLVRDDSFDVFRRARLEADIIGFAVGWELMAENESIKFGPAGLMPGTE